MTLKNRLFGWLFTANCNILHIELRTSLTVLLKMLQIEHFINIKKSLYYGENLKVFDLSYSILTR